MMIARTLYFGNPAYLSRRNNQLVVRLPQVEKNDTLPDSFKKEAQATIPIEDIGVVILDEPRLVITQSLIEGLLANNVALITCDNTHLPTGLMLNLTGHSLQSAIVRDQFDASLPLKKQLWQQTVKAKIKNQASLLKQRGVEVTNLVYWSSQVRSGDPDNFEARAAAYYWKNVFPELKEFKRDRNGDAPNLLLNFAYAILRANVARSLVGSGLLPIAGIHHRNQYNHYCLADDIMEPYRPFVDHAVANIVAQGEDFTALTTSIKKQLLAISFTDVLIEGERSPLTVAIQRTTASLARCFEKVGKSIVYPEFEKK